MTTENNPSEDKTTNRLKESVMLKKNKSKQALDISKSINSNIESYMSPVMDETVLDGEVVVRLDCADIDVNPYQNRMSFDPEGLEDLARSIKENRQSQPIIIRRNGDRYQLISGERRWRACSLLGIKVDAVIRDMDNLEMVYGCYSENDSRKKTNDYEKSRTIKHLLDQKRPVDEIIRRLNMKKTDYYKRLKFHQMPASIQAYLKDNTHALQRNEVSDLHKLQIDLGGSFTPEMEQAILDLCDQYVKGKLKNRSDIVKLFKKRFVTPKTRNRAKINEEHELMSGDVKVGRLLITPTQIQYTFEKSELDKPTLEKLQLAIMDFIENY